MDYLSFRHARQHFAVPIESVRFIAAESALTPTQVATGKGQQFDMVEFEGQACIILSLARLLNQPSERSKSLELLELLQAREQDHINWLNSLKNCLLHGGSFDLARDPHQCKFGQWYDNFRTDDTQLQHVLRRFDEPHKRIHALADELLAMRDNDQSEAALAILQEQETSTMQRLRDLFADVNTMVRSSIRPTVIMLQSNEQQTLGLRVDDVGEVFSCSAAQLEKEQKDYMPPFARGWLKGVRIGGKDVTIMEINPARLLSSTAINEGQMLA